jgi:hypothetical protein
LPSARASSWRSPAAPQAREGALIGAARVFGEPPLVVVKRQVRQGDGLVAGVAGLPVAGEGVLVVSVGVVEAALVAGEDAEVAQHASLFAHVPRGPGELERQGEVSPALGDAPEPPLGAPPRGEGSYPQERLALRSR